MPVAIASRTVDIHQRRPRKIKHGPKVIQYGIEVAKGLTWREWEPGGEYTKHVVLKNVNMKTQKFNYSSPSSRFFTTLYPEAIVLSAGTSFSLPVTFRPLEKNIYEDKIEFHTQDGSFTVPIKAVLPKHELSLPEHLHFGLCASYDQVQLTFELHNVSELKTDYLWSVQKPFVLDPSSGTLEPKSKCTIVATFKPTASLVYETIAECFFGQNYSCKRCLRLEGIGKYPHILVGCGGKNSKALFNPNLESVISFPDVAIGSYGERYIELHNLSPVNAPFTIDHPTSESRMDTVFRCTQLQGTVHAESICKIPIFYTPHSVNEESVDYLYVQAVGNVSKTTVKLVGKCKGPSVALGSKILNFGRISGKDHSHCSLDIINHADVEAAFQFVIDCSESAFKFSTVTDSVSPHTTQTILIEFKPSHPINYHRRVTCLVQNQDPLFIDLIGTCHSEMEKPAILQPKHLQQFKIHEARGFSVFPPEQLNAMLKESKIHQDENGYLMDPQAESLEEYLQPPEPLLPMKEFFGNPYSKDSDQVLHISLDSQTVNFGNCTNLQYIEQKTLNVTNHTKGKITVVWMGDANHTFSISPQSCDIPPLKMTSFRVTFKPNAPNTFFGHELEGYAFYKSMRDYRLVQDETFSRPWCLTVSAIGQTFQPGNKTFLSNYAMDVTKLVFPAVDTGDSIFKTLLMKNTGDTPIHFQIPDDPKSVFAIKPSLGLIKEKHQLFVVRKTPKENKRLHHTFSLRLNDSDQQMQNIKVSGSSEQPNVLLETEGVLFFKPTCLGTSSSRTYKVRNISRVPLKFEWICSHKDKKFISVQPSSGTILPNEIQAHMWTFAPQEQTKYIFKPYLQVEDVRHIGDLSRRKRFILRAVGEGSEGQIKVAESALDLADVLVGSSITKEIVLYNNGNCSLHYQLLVDQKLTGSYSEEAVESDKCALELSFYKDIIPARSKRIIKATARPIRRMGYQFNISYQLLMPKLHPEKSEEQMKSGPNHLSSLTMAGVFPTLQVTDARCYGSASGVSKARLWNLFSLDNLNMTLDGDPSLGELMYPVPTRHSTTRKMPSSTRAIMDFNFSAAPIGAEPCVVHLMLDNTGSVPAEWSFLFPTDMQLEIEYWAEVGEFDVDELHEMRVMDNKLFTIEPKKGCLGPGQSQTISLSYSHQFSGTDRLPVMFKVSHGREVLLNFIGVTVDLQKKYVHFPSNKHMFAPVPIGRAKNAHQIYELYNGGSTAVRYHLDLTALELIQEGNFDQKVFQCLNPLGEIQPGRSANVEWIFSPMEAKTYTVDVPIHIIGGDTALVTFSGVGYDNRLLGKSMTMQPRQEGSGVPAIQRVLIPGQLLYLSQERVSFGNLPLFSQTRKVIYLKNMSPNHSIFFEWFVTSEADGQVVDVQPACATLQPGETCTCKVCFTAIGEPSFYDLDVICEVTDEVVLAQYEADIKAWEAEKKRQKYEFTITEKDVNPELAPKSGKLCRSLKGSAVTTRRNTPSPDRDFKKYQTLPPIKNTKSEREIDKQFIDERQTETGTPLWEKPQRPDPFILHLGVTGRTHDIAEFQSNFPNEVSKFYIDRTMSERLRPTNGRGSVPTDMEEEPLNACSDEEHDAVAAAVANIIRALLDDHDFHSALEEIPKEPIPYFNQFCDRPQSLSRIGEARLISPPARANSQVEIVKKPVSPAATEVVDVHKEDAERAVETKPKPQSAPTVVNIAQDTPALTAPRSLAEASPGAHTEAEYQQSLLEEQHRLEQQMLKRLPEFGMMLEAVLDNTLFNIITEANRNEINLTARPRRIALPPSIAPAPHTPPHKGGRPTQGPSSGGTIPVKEKLPEETFVENKES